MIAEPRLGMLLQKLAATPEGAALFSIQVAAGVFGEWHYYGFTENEPDVGPAMTARFREWLKAKYGAAIHTKRVCPESRSGCGPTVISATRGGTAGSSITCTASRAVTDAFVHFCRAVKESWP